MFHSHKNKLYIPEINFKIFFLSSVCISRDKIKGNRVDTAVIYLKQLLETAVILSPLMQKLAFDSYPRQNQQLLQPTILQDGKNSPRLPDGQFSHFLLLTDSISPRSRRANGILISIANITHTHSRTYIQMQ